MGFKNWLLFHSSLELTSHQKASAFMGNKGMAFHLYALDNLKSAVFVQTPGIGVVCQNNQAQAAETSLPCFLFC